MDPDPNLNSNEHINNNKKNGIFFIIYKKMDNYLKRIIAGLVAGLIVALICMIVILLRTGTFKRTDGGEVKFVDAFSHILGFQALTLDGKAGYAVIPKIIIVFFGAAAFLFLVNDTKWKVKPRGEIEESKSESKSESKRESESGLL
jgi:hypothetical protein